MSGNSDHDAHDRDRPPLDGPNPLLQAWREGVGRDDEPARRDAAIARYAFAVPDDAALAAVARIATAGVVEIGAGTGYWARLLSDHGVGIEAFDVAPAASPENPWFADSRTWFEVRAGDESELDRYGNATLMIVWPTKNEDWPGDAVTRFASAGGSTLVYVGEGPNSHTGDDRFHALVGAVDRCWSCAYGITTAACICGIVPLYSAVERVTLPHWTGYEDDLHVLERVHDARPLGPSPARGAERRARLGRWRRRNRDAA